ncbi:hypothetical protein [Aquabacterium sp. OR-4]|uniref:hypothetical protein n=1 Tax=Aquabacterium sp. OR-4 TaxID=2978127 RepID=UPI0028C7A49D|nr:hypothetical protein [Aquabacterium sp. OR-4]MDT7834983.1 hypothetical protein [Aquabacterium sp. OR-4]
MIKRLRYVGRRLGWTGYATILRDLQRQPATAQEIAARHDVQLQTARRVMARLHELRAIHIRGWTRPHVRGSSIPIWAFGLGADVIRPDPPSGTPRQPLSRSTALPELVQVVQILRLLEREPISKTALAAEVGSQWANVGRFVEHCRAIGLVRIADWEQRLRGGAPAALYQLGSGPDAKRPARQDRREIERRSRLARQAKAQTARLIAATAAPVGMGAAA